MTRILAIHAHPDDVENLCAGTLALLSGQGHAVTIATVTAGDCGALDTDNATTARIRKGEAAAAARLIGADYMCLDVPDLSVFVDDATRRRVTEALRAAQPQIVITASPVDYHPDHEAASFLVRDACFAAPVPNYKTGSANVLADIPHLYFCDPIAGRDRDNNKVMAEFAVDVAPFFDLKKDMLRQHKSQAAWEAKQHGLDDYVEAMVEWTKRRGHHFGVGFAEGFRQYRTHPYPASPLLQEMVGAALVRPPAS
jgi:LmbE family N-acetylglucosaminyl deacetylase